jgi:D-glycero-alpha-D-manno-heptose-7-phosphate kinase
MPYTAFPARSVTESPQSFAGAIIRAKAPLRISFAGGGTDLPHYYERHGGAVLSSTINRYAYVTLYPREDAEVRIRSLDLGHLVRYSLDSGPVYDGVLDLAKAAIHRVGIKRGIDMDIRLEAPAGSGLGGSSALTAAVLGAVAAMNGHPLAAYELAELNYLIERTDLKIAGGKQDQYATTFGGFNLIEFHADRVLVTPLRIDRAVLNDLEAHLLLCYTGKVRPHLGLIEQQVRFLQEGRKETLEGMKQLQEMTYQMKEVLLTGRLHRFGELLHEAYVSKKLMNPHITGGTSADELYEAARQRGAVGGKLCGAGGGGYLLLYCQTGQEQEVIEALEDLGGRFTNFSFEGMGLQVWRSNSR